jgi:hypothetical protein
LVEPEKALDADVVIGTAAHPADHLRTLDPAAVARVLVRLGALNAALRTAIHDPSPGNAAVVVDAARWARLEVDSALALKGHVAGLRDQSWCTLKFTTRSAALATFTAFVDGHRDALDLVEMRNLRARLEGLLTIARGLAT